MLNFKIDLSKFYIEFIEIHVALHFEYSILLYNQRTNKY